jgi:hypothetical protein
VKIEILRYIQEFEISRIKYLRNKELGLSNLFDIHVSFVCEISHFQICKFNCTIVEYSSIHSLGRVFKRLKLVSPTFFGNINMPTD